MTRRTPITLLGAAAVPLVALAVAGCGGGNSATAGTPPAKTTSPPAVKTPVASPPKATTAHGATVSVAKTGLGKVLVDSQGRTLYLFKGASGTKSAPTSAFAAWPPLRASGKPTVGRGAKASLVGTAKDAAGQTQVTYKGHPLYTFVKDQKPGDTTGEGVIAFGGTWLVVSPAGNAISGKPAAPKPAPAKPAAPKPAPTKPAAPKPAPAKPAPAKPAAPPAAKKPAPSNGIPQNNGGDGDADNNGGPSDGDGGI
jgi:predicted lipoprotein with Yx(FWY)xxD motif